MVVVAVAGALGAMRDARAQPTDAAPAGAPSPGENIEELTRLADGTPVFRRRTRAARRTEAIAVDGVLAEPAWQQAPATRIDWQQLPVEGAPPTGYTDFRILYDDDALYVGVHARDPEPDQIRGLLYRPVGFRKVEQSDLVLVYVSPTTDRSVGYAFCVNPAGVKVDFRLTQRDTDETYTGIWEGVTSRDASGWYVEYRIPFSQMRITSGAQGTWGLQVERKVSRKQENSYWSPFPTTWSQELLAMGDVVIDDRIDHGYSLEVLPYAVGGSRLDSAARTDPLRDQAELAYGAGADVKLRVGALRLTAAVNPDFGEFEADPAEVNLTDRETFFTERRPLFIEDADLFSMALDPDTGENLFYSRRIGARPHFTLADDAAFFDEDQVTTIYGAAKVSGEVPGGAKIGLLSAVGARETSRGVLDTGGRVDRVIEPLTLYHVGQLSQTFRDGATDVRVAGTAVHRSLDGTDIVELHRSAYSGAAQVLHQLAKGEWQLSGLFGGSRVAGDPMAIAITQRSSRRYFQRPDAEHVEFDPTRTELAGYVANAKVARVAGTWTGSLGVDARSPGLETNDLGFLLDADFLAATGTLGYQRVIKTGKVRLFTASGTLETATNFAPEVLGHTARVDTKTVMRTNWGVLTRTRYTRQELDTRLLRGGPAVHGDDAVEVGGQLITNQSRSARLIADAGAIYRPASGSLRTSLVTQLAWDILPNLEVTVQPTWIRNHDNTQYVGTVADAMGTPHYVLGELRQNTLVAATRLNYTLSLKLSLQLYAEPFLSGARFTAFKEAADVRSTQYDERFARFEPGQTMESMGNVDVDRDGDGLPDLTFRRPDLQLGSLLTNFVMRYEFRPGSTAYLIWSQSRQGLERDGALSGGDLAGVFTNKSVHVVLLKLSLWMNL